MRIESPAVKLKILDKGGMICRFHRKWLDFLKSTRLRSDYNTPTHVPETYNSKITIVFEFHAKAAMMSYSMQPLD